MRAGGIWRNQLFAYRKVRDVKQNSCDLVYLWNRLYGFPWTGQVPEFVVLEGIPQATGDFRIVKSNHAGLGSIRRIVEVKIKGDLLADGNADRGVEEQLGLSTVLQRMEEVDGPAQLQPGERRCFIDNLEVCKERRVNNGLWTRGRSQNAGAVGGE